MTAALHLDRGSGRVTVILPESVVTIEPPCAADWAKMVDRLALVDTDDIISDQAAHLNLWILRTCGHPGCNHPTCWPLWCYDPSIAHQLLVHWRDWPYSPFVSTDAPHEPTTADDVDEHVAPGTRALASLYRACRGTLTPFDIDRMKLWQIAAMFPPDEATEPAQRPEVKVGSYHQRSRARVGPGGPAKAMAWQRNPTLPDLYPDPRPMTMPDRPDA